MLKVENSIHIFRVCPSQYAQEMDKLSIVTIYNTVTNFSPQMEVQKSQSERLVDRPNTTTSGQRLTTFQAGEHDRLLPQISSSNALHRH